MWRTAERWAFRSEITGCISGTLQIVYFYWKSDHNEMSSSMHCLFWILQPLYEKTTWICASKNKRQNFGLVILLLWCHMNTTNYISISQIITFAIITMINSLHFNKYHSTEKCNLCCSYTSHLWSLHAAVTLPMHMWWLRWAGKWSNHWHLF